MKKVSLLSFGFCLTIIAVSCADNATTTNSTTDSTSSTTMSGDSMSTTPPATEETGVMVGGANMVPSKDIVDNAAASSDHTTLVAAVKAAGLVETLKGTGPFTVFAPTNEAFNKLPAGTVDNLLKPEMKNDLSKVLTYHVVPGKITSADLKDGQVVTTVQGDKFTLMMKDGKWMIKDAKGGMANITIADVISSNGATHVIDGVLMPK